MPYELDLSEVQTIDRLMRLIRKDNVEKLNDEPQGLSEGIGRTFFVSSTSSKAASTNSGLEPSAPFHLGSGHRGVGGQPR